MLLTIDKNTTGTSSKAHTTIRLLLGQSGSTKQSGNLVHSATLASNSLVAANSNGHSTTSGNKSRGVVGVGQSVGEAITVTSQKKTGFGLSLTLANIVDTNTSSRSKGDTSRTLLLKEGRGRKNAGNLMNGSTLSGYSLVSANGGVN